MAEFLHAFNEFRISQQFCDINIILDDQTKYALHQNILAARSEYFRALLTTKLPATSIKKTGRVLEIKLNDVEKDIFDVIVEYIYTSEIRITEENAVDLYISADYLGVQEIILHCITFFVNRLQPENCLDMYNLSRRLICEDLKTKIKMYICQNFLKFNNAREGNQIYDLPRDCLLKLLSSNYLNTNKEEDVWQFILRWIEKDVPNRQSYLSMFLREVRLGGVEGYSLTGKIARNSLVRSDAQCKLLIDVVRQFHCAYRCKRDVMTPNVTPKFVHPRIPYSLLFAIGGGSWKGEGALTQVVEAYDPKADVWVEVPRLQLGCPLGNHGSATIDSKIYIIGGLAGYQFINTCRYYDFQTNSWVHIAPMNIRRWYLSVVALNGYIYALGGYDGNVWHKTVERYNPVSNEWTIVSPMNIARSDTDSTVLNGQIYIVGGFNGSNYLSTAEVYDPNSDQWTVLPSMCSVRSGASCTAYHGYIYALGGFNGTKHVNTVERFSPVQYMWKSVASMCKASSNSAADVIDDTLMVIGGYDGTTSLLTTEHYDEVNNEWKPRATMNIDRVGLTCCVISGLPNIELYLHPLRHNLREARRLQQLVSSYSN